MSTMSLAVGAVVQPAQEIKEAADQLELFLKSEPDAKDTELIKKLIKRFRQQSGEAVKQ